MKIDSLGLAVTMALAGLGLFLVAIKMMSSSIKNMSSEYTEKLLLKVTKNKWVGVLFGIGFTTMIQSSDGTVALVIALISAGLLTLRGAIPIILGANIGTATTAAIVALGGADSSAFAFVQYFPIMVFVGAAILLFVKVERKITVGYLLFAVGAIFFGLKVMGAGMKAITAESWFHSFVSSVGKNPWTGFFSNSALTGVVQSSSATVTVVQNIFVADKTGQMGMTLSTAIGMIIGANIGTTFTALIASIGAKKDAKRIAVVWLTTNFLMAIVLLPMISQYADLIGLVQPNEALSANPTLNQVDHFNSILKFQLAWAHLIFNTMMVVVFIWFIKPLEWWASYVIKEKETKLKYEVHLPQDLINESPTLALTAAEKSISALGRMSEDAIKLMQQYLKTQEKKLNEEFRDLVDLIEITRKTLFAYLIEIGTKDITKAQANRQASFLLGTRSFERITVIGNQAMKEIARGVKKGKTSFDENEANDMIKLLIIVERMTSRSSKQLHRRSSTRTKDLKQLRDHLDDEIAKLSASFVRKKQNIVGFDYILTLKLISRMGHHAHRVDKYIIRGTKGNNLSTISVRLEKEIAVGK